MANGLPFVRRLQAMVTIPNFVVIESFHLQDKVSESAMRSKKADYILGG